MYMNISATPFREQIDRLFYYDTSLSGYIIA